MESWQHTQNQHILNCVCVSACVRIRVRVRVRVCEIKRKHFWQRSLV